jgi:hypothetical protein
MRAATVGTCLVLALLELVHPASEGGSVWVPLHVALLVAYAALCTLLWLSTPSHLARAALVAFGLANTLFLAIDGLLGLSSTPVQLLADVVGALWCLALFALAAQHGDRPTFALLVLAWLAFVASAAPLGITPLVSRALVLAAGAWLVYRSGTSAMPAALLVFAGVLRQHVGPEAALGMVCVAIAGALKAE